MEIFHAHRHRIGWYQIKGESVAKYTGVAAIAPGIVVNDIYYWDVINIVRLLVF